MIEEMSTAFGKEEMKEMAGCGCKENLVDKENIVEKE